VHPQAKFAHVMKSTRGKAPKNVALYDSAKRKTVDKEFTDLAVEYIKKNAKGSKPFFLYIPYTQTHMPVDPHPDYKGKTGNGGYADVLMQTDDYVGAILGEVKKQGIEDNTIFIFTSDNGPEGLENHEGFSGPWRGSYFTGLEGSLRVPFLIQWPNKIKADTLSNDIVHEMDLFATFANIAGGKVPQDRILDSVDMADFFTGKAAKSVRESVVVYNGTDVYGVKWRDWKMMVREIKSINPELSAPLSMPKFYNLLQDPKEERPMRLAPANLWVRYPASQVLIDHAKSLAKEPPIKAGTPDPYVPKAG
jgi:arylsulfatase